RHPFDVPVVRTGGASCPVPPGPGAAREAALRGAAYLGADLTAGGLTTGKLIGPISAVARPLRGSEGWDVFVGHEAPGGSGGFVVAEAGHGLHAPAAGCFLVLVLAVLVLGTLRGLAACRGLVRAVVLVLSCGRAARARRAARAGRAGRAGGAAGGRWVGGGALGEGVGGGGG